jgi:hypothetical protein
LIDGVQCRIEFPLQKTVGRDRPTDFSGSHYPLPSEPYHGNGRILGAV